MGRHWIGLLGVGRLGTRLGHQCRRTPDVELAALADVSESARERAGSDLGLPAERRHPTFESMLAGEPLDAVAISTPHALHYDQILAAFDHGLDVLCEKPLVTDVDRARDLCERAESGDEALMVGYQRHFEEPYQVAREVVRERIEPTFVTAELVEDWIAQNVDTWRLDPELSGGGFLYDTGSHVLDAVLWMTGLTPTAVTAEMSFHDERIDRSAAVTVAFESGATANLSFHGDLPRVREHVHVWGEQGAVYLDGREWGDRTLRIVEADGTVTSPFLEDALAPAETSRTKIDVFAAVLEGDREPPATARDALVTTAVTEAAYRSATTGERVAVPLA